MPPKLVLLCDVIIRHLDVLSPWLHDAGYTVLMATTAKRAHYQLGIVRFDLVIADMGRHDQNFLRILQAAGYNVLCTSQVPYSTIPSLPKPDAVRHFPAYREPFLRKVAELLGE